MRRLMLLLAILGITGPGLLAQDYFEVVDVPTNLPAMTFCRSGRTRRPSGWTAERAEKKMIVENNIRSILRILEPH